MLVQEKTAELQKTRIKGKIATEIVPEAQWYTAEEYHQVRPGRSAHAWVYVDGTVLLATKNGTCCRLLLQGDQQGKDPDVLHTNLPTLRPPGHPWSGVCCCCAYISHRAHVPAAEVPRQGAWRLLQPP